MEIRFSEFGFQSRPLRFVCDKIDQP